MAGMDPSVVGVNDREIVFFQLSPLHRITLDVESKDAARIPRSANYFAWVYPMVQDGGAPLFADGTPESALLDFGGFIYFNDERDAVQLNSLRPAPLDTPGLTFGRPQNLPQSVTQSLSKQGRFQEITLDVLRQAGATYFGWIRPNEFPTVACPDGCFCYKFSSGPPKYFPIVQKPVFTSSVVQEALDEHEAWVVLRYAEPQVEVPRIMDKRKTLDENIAGTTDTSTEPSTILGGDGFGAAVVGKDSDGVARYRSYDDWVRRSQDPGTLVDPWIISQPVA